MSKVPNNYRRILFSYFFLFIPVVFYLLTVSKEIGLPDSAILIDAMASHTVSSHVCSHNLSNIIGWLFLKFLPSANTAFKANLFSAACGSAAVSFFYFMLLQAGLRPPLASLCSSIFMVSHSMWWHSTHVENYALNLLFFHCCVLLVYRDMRKVQKENKPNAPEDKYLKFLLFIAALSIFNHVQNAAFLLAAFIYFLRRLKYCPLSLPKIFTILIYPVIGLIPYLITLTYDYLHHGKNVLSWASGGAFHEWFSLANFFMGIKEFSNLLFLQFPSLFLLFVFSGILRIIFGFFKRQREQYSPTPDFFIIPVFIISLAVFLNYKAWDLFSFYLPVFSVLAFYGSISAHSLAEKFPKMRCVVLLILASGILMPPFIYNNISKWTDDKDGYWGKRYYAIKQQYRYRYDLVAELTNPFFRDPNNSIAAFSKKLLSSLPANSMFIDDVSTYHQLLYYQNHTGLRKDIDLILIQPVGFEGWGIPLAEIIKIILMQTEEKRFFVVTDTGVCADLINQMYGFGWSYTPFAISLNHKIYELLPFTSEQFPKTSP